MKILSTGNTKKTVTTMRRNLTNGGKTMVLLQVKEMRENTLDLDQEADPHAAIEADLQECIETLGT
jgi:hypothetical protein